MGKDLGIFYSNELKLKLLKQFSNSYEFATMVFPMPNEKVTASMITFLNNNSPYLSNFDYSDKHIVKIYKNDKATHAEELLAGAKLLLDEVSVPKITYELALTDIKDDVHLGDAITLIDKIKNIKIRQRVVKIVRYPY